MAIVLAISKIIFAQAIVECRGHESIETACNQYGPKLIRAQTIHYDLDSKKPIMSKTLPVPKKRDISRHSVLDILEKYVHIYASLRFAHKEKIFEMYEQTSQQTDLSKKSTQKKITIQSYGTYQVVRGDTLSTIAEKLGFSMQELSLLNHLDRKAILKIGQKIKIPLSQKIVDSIMQAEYTIAKGDTLLSIAYQFNLDPKKLSTFNHIKSSHIIHEGKKLSLPLPYVMKRIALEKKRKEAERKRKLALAKKKEALRLEALKREEKRYLRQRRKRKHTLRVTATAYTSHRRQTDRTPFIAAWNNHIRPGMKLIAVSRDLIRRYGLRNGMIVKIGGLRGYYRVRDKMNKRFRKRIDIYMGLNKRRALRWGRRSVVIYW